MKNTDNKCDKCEVGRKSIVENSASCPYYCEDKKTGRCKNWVCIKDNKPK